MYRTGGQRDVIMKRFGAELLDRIPLNGGIIPPEPSGRALGDRLFWVEAEHKFRLYALGGIIA